jgi:hypothetical protein
MPQNGKKQAVICLTVLMPSLTALQKVLGKILPVLTVIFARFWGTLIRSSITMKAFNRKWLNP